MSDNTNCLNCNLSVSGNFCSSCGQRINLPRITFKEIITQFFDTVFNVEAPFPITFLSLFSRPHDLIQQFIRGKRKCYYAPIRYLVLCLFIVLLLGEITGFDPIENQKNINPGESANNGSEVGYLVGQFLSKYLNYFIFFFPFSIAIITKIFFWKTKFNFAERTVMGFYLSGQYLLLNILPILLTFINPRLMNLAYLFSISYLSYAFYKMFLKNSKIKVLIKSLLAAIFSVLLYFFTSAIIAYMIITYSNT